MVVVPLLVGGGTRLKIFEAMAMEKAIVAPRLGPLEEAISDRVHGRLFEPKAKQSLYDVIVELVHDQKQRERLGQEARRHVFAKHTWTKNAEAVIDAYHDVKRHSRRPQASVISAVTS